MVGIVDHAWIDNADFTRADVLHQHHVIIPLDADILRMIRDREVMGKIVVTP